MRLKDIQFDIVWNWNLMKRIRFLVTYDYFLIHPVSFKFLRIFIFLIIDLSLYVIWIPLRFADDYTVIFWFFIVSCCGHEFTCVFKHWSVARFVKLCELHLLSTFYSTITFCYLRINSLITVAPTDCYYVLTFIRLKPNEVHFTGGELWFCFLFNHFVFLGFKNI